MKKNYVVITPYCGDEAIIDNETGDVLETPRLNSIYNELIDGEIADHLFYIDNIEELIEYDNLRDACILLYDIAAIYFDDYPEIDNVDIIFFDQKTDEALFLVNVDSSDDFYRVDVINIQKPDFEDECDGDCEHCPYNEDDEETHNDYIMNSFHFGLR